MKGFFRMKIGFLKLALVLIAILGIVQIDAVAQTRARNTPAPPSLMAALPKSDAVAQVKMKQLFNEAMPRILANNQARLAQVNASVEDFKTRTGLDPRQFDQLALGVRFTFPGEGRTKVQTVALAQGSYSSNALITAGSLAANGKYRQEKYQGKTIYIFTLDQSVTVFGVFDFKINELAVLPLDANTLALGDLMGIRSLIDATNASKRANAELIALASRDPNAVAGFGANMSQQLVSSIDAIGNAPIGAELANLRQVYGSVSTTEKDIELFLGAKAVSPEAAKNLGDTLNLLKDVGSAFVGRISGARGVLAKSALTNLKIVADANELQIRTAVPQADVGPLMGN
jgi:hypothetical protein